MNVSRNFTLEEFVRSQTAQRKGIDNTPPPEAIENLRKLCVHTLEPIRDLFPGHVVQVSSGYRCKKLNSAIGGSPTSQHMKGQAADFTISGVSVADAFRKIIQAEFQFVQFDQLISEFGSWIHVSYGSPLRREKLIAYKDEQNKTQYRRI